MVKSQLWPIMENSQRQSQSCKIYLQDQLATATMSVSEITPWNV